jgi:hypothetical protein
MVDNMSDHSDCCKERPCIFMKYLYEEKNIHKGHRFSLVQRKLFFIGTLLGFGSLSILRDDSYINFSILVYLVPFMAIAYDIFIFAEDYKVKRVGAFLRNKCKNTCQDEKKWESFVYNNREPLAVFGTVFLTILAFFAAVVILIINSKIDYWSIALFLILIILYSLCYYKLIESNKKLSFKN